MRAECRAVRRSLLLGEGGSASIREHLRDCNECREFDLTEREVAGLVRRMVARPPAPRSLRERLLVALEMERGRSGRRWKLSRARIAVIAIAAMVAAGSGWIYLGRGAREARRTVEALALDHLKYAGGERGPELTSSSPHEVVEWLRDRTRLGVRLQDLPEASLLGARRCSVRGRPAALVFYRLAGDAAPGSSASLFAFESGGEDWSQMEAVAGGGARRVCRAHDRGLSVLVWEDRGLTYALVSELPDADLETLAERLL
jgi:anti-sigma factor RsiW